MTSMKVKDDELSSCNLRIRFSRPQAPGDPQAEDEGAVRHAAAGLDCTAEVPMVAKLTIWNTVAKPSCPFEQHDRLRRRRAGKAGTAGGDDRRCQDFDPFLTCRISSSSNDASLQADARPARSSRRAARQTCRTSVARVRMVSTAMCKGMNGTLSSLRVMV